MTKEDSSSAELAIVLCLQTLRHSGHDAQCADAHPKPIGLQHENH